ncbi:MAG: nucleoside triphosphate pyrophosphohydrolase [Nanoarchaeota archaeon]
MKLVRDKVPDVIRSNNQKAIFHVANDQEYKEALLKKLEEEVKEFQHDKTAQELGDLLDIIDAIAFTFGFSKEYIEGERKKKNQERGSFSKRVILDKIEK